MKITKNISVAYFLSIIISSVLAISCSNNSGGSGGGGGAPEKQSGGPEASKSISTSISAVNSVLNSKSNTRFNSAQTKTAQVSLVNNVLNSALTKISANKPSEDNTKNSKKIENKVNSMIDSSQCEIAIPIEKNKSRSSSSQSSNASINDIFVEIKGDNCPLYAKISVATKAIDKTISAAFEMSFIAKTPELQKELDIAQMTLIGNLSMSTEQDPNMMKINGLVDLSGDGSSITYGPFKMKVDSSVNMEMLMNAHQQKISSTNNSNQQMNPIQNMNLKASEHQLYEVGRSKIELSAEVIKNPEANIDIEKYLVNGQGVTAEKYAEYVSQMDFLGLNSSDSSQGNGVGTTPSKSNMNCKVLLYDAKSITPDQLYNKWQFAQNINLIPIATVESCGKNKSIKSTLNNHEIKIDLLFLSDVVNARFFHENESQSVYISNDNKDLVTRGTQQITWGIACEPIDQCN